MQTSLEKLQQLQKEVLEKIAGPYVSIMFELETYKWHECMRNMKVFPYYDKANEQLRRFNSVISLSVLNPEAALTAADNAIKFYNKAKENLNNPVEPSALEVIK